MTTRQFKVSTSAYIQDDCPMQYRSDEDGVDVVLGSCDDGVQLGFTRQSLANLIELANHAVDHGTTGRHHPVTLANLTSAPSRSMTNSPNGPT